MSVVTGIPRTGLVLEPGRLASLRTDPLTETDPAIPELARVLDAPSGELLVSISGEAGETRLACAIEGPTAVVTMARPSETAELAVVTSDSIPGIIALAAGLGPAPFVEEPEPRATIGELEGYLSGARPPSEGDEVSAAARVFAHPGVRSWSAYLTVTGPDAATDRMLLDVVGGAGIGWWILDIEGEDARLIRTRAAHIWSMLCGIAARGSRGADPLASAPVRGEQPDRIPQR